MPDVVMNLNLVDASWDASHLDFNAGHQLMDIMWLLNFLMKEDYNNVYIFPFIFSPHTTKPFFIF